MKRLAAPAPGIIDLHVHVFPDRMFEAVWKRFKSLGWTEFSEFLLLMDDHPNMFFDTAVINIVDHRLDSRYPVPPERLARYAHRICFGSDWPFVHYDYQTALDSVKQFGFPPQTYQKVMRDNAMRFLKIDLDQ